MRLGFMKRLKLRTKLLLAFLSVVLFSLAPICFYLISENTSDTFDYIDRLNKASFLQLAGNVERQFEVCLRSAAALVAEPRIINYMVQLNGAESDPNQKLLEYARLINEHKPKLDALSLNGEEICFYTDNTEILAGNYIATFSDPPPWYNAAVSAVGSCVIGTPYENKLQRLLIPIARAAGGANQNGTTSVLRFSFPEDNLYKLIEEEGENKSIYIIREDGLVLSSTDRGASGSLITPDTQFRSEFMAQAYVFDRTDNNETIFCQRLNLNIAGAVYVYCAVSNEYVLNEVGNNIVSSLVFIFVVMVISCVGITLMINSMTRRLERLAQTMAGIHEGSLKVYNASNDGYMDEIGNLWASFSAMIERVNNLIGQVYAAEATLRQLEQKTAEARLRALYGQINPHFIFNLLESMSMSLFRSGETTVSKIMRDFGYILRRTIDWSQTIIPFSEEIALLELYIGIQKFRFKDRIGYEISIAEELHAFCIPKFTLQPIVENAIVHGIEPKEGNGMIYVRGQLADGCVMITVTDNGVGLGEDELSGLRAGLDEADPPVGGSIGLGNVHQRLKLNYGDAYGVRIDSTPGVGTVVEIRLPVAF